MRRSIRMQFESLGTNDDYVPSEHAQMIMEQILDHSLNKPRDAPRLRMSKTNWRGAAYSLLQTIG